MRVQRSFPITGDWNRPWFSGKLLLDEQRKLALKHGRFELGRFRGTRRIQYPPAPRIQYVDCLVLSIWAHKGAA